MSGEAIEPRKRINARPPSVLAKRGTQSLPERIRASNETLETRRERC